MSLDVMIAATVSSTRVMIGTAANDGSEETRSPRKSHVEQPLADISAPVAVAATSDASTSTFARDLLELTKPRIVMMVLVTTLVAAIVAGSGQIDLTMLVHLFIGVALVAGSAGAMNQVWERNIDCEMERTKRRPLPAGRLSPWTAFFFSVVIGTAGTCYLAAFLGTVPALVGLVTWITYVPIYTPLKTRSAWNTTVGAVSGALPVLIGYTAAGGGLSDLQGWLLVGVLVAWQYPHFMAIAWLYRRQYQSAGFQMTTTVEPTGRSAGWQSVLGMVGLVACLLGLSWMAVDDRSWRLVMWAACLIIVSYPMTKAAIGFARDRNDGTARKLLRASLLQLPASLLLITAASIVG